MTAISDARVLVTGAASGIGWLLSERLARLGAEVILWDINQTTLKESQEKLTREGLKAHAYHCDLSDKVSIIEAGKRTRQEVGGVDIVINNAGIVAGKEFLDLSDEDIEKTFSINTLALFRVTKVWLESMEEQGHGHIVTIASAGGITGTAKLVDYCSSKFAAVGFDESLRVELKRRNSPVKTTVICPYYIDTGMFEGVKTRFPRLLPILRPNDVVEKTINAIRKNKPRVIMPWLVYTSWMAKLMPVSIHDALMSYLGINKSMDEFKGRSKEAVNERS
ncbi:MAG: SDR family oxidoreductase [Pseudomonadota bacterium]